MHHAIQDSKLDGHHCKDGCHSKGPVVMRFSLSDFRGNSIDCSSKSPFVEVAGSFGITLAGCTSVMFD